MLESCKTQYHSTPKKYQDDHHSQLKDLAPQKGNVILK
jgi:hypothetical protein